MKFSAWSLLVISACSLAFASSASAHISVVPTQVKEGALVDVTFSAPNADDPNGISQVTITPPAGFVLDDGEAKPGWTQTRTGSSLTWAGGNIPLRQYATFALRGTVPPRSGTIVFDVRVADHTGKAITYRVPLGVAGSKTDWGKPALIVALVAVALALGAFFVALYVWLRPPR
jgi:uncharacterized protein YcnI